MLLICMSGHSGAGKSRLLEALAKRKTWYRKAILYTSRPARTDDAHGKDYYFLSRGLIEQLPLDAFFVGQVHEMLQAVDLVQLECDLRSEEPVIVEIFHTLWAGLKETMKRRLGGSLATASVFLTAIDPRSLKQASREVAADRIKSEVRSILEWRGKDRADEILQRAESAVDEVLTALRVPRVYDTVLYSAPEGPDGEDDWTRDEFPTGRAARTVEQFLSFMQKRKGGGRFKSKASR